MKAGENTHFGGRVGITGPDGFLGWHLRCRLVSQGVAPTGAGRQQLSDAARAAEFVKSSDIVLHVAGVNRAEDEGEIRAGNLKPAAELAQAIRRADCPPSVVYANSVKADGPGLYGEAKAEAGEMLKDACAEAGSGYVDIKFPHLFGEFGRPNYNSGVTTFAHDLAHGLPSTINDGQLELLHAQQAAQMMIDAACSDVGDTIRASGRALSVGDAYALLQRLAAPYVTDRTFPEIADLFELRMFNMLRSQMWPDAYPYPLARHADERGAFFEVCRSFGQGQSSISTTVPGVVRGEHFHFDKVERFVVISGCATIRVRRLFNDVVSEFAVTGNEPSIIDMPPLCTHDITNTGDADLITMFWSHDHFDPATADTYPLAVVGEDLPA